MRCERRRPSPTQPSTAPRYSVHVADGERSAEVEISRALNRRWVAGRGHRAGAVELERDPLDLERRACEQRLGDREVAADTEVEPAGLGLAVLIGISDLAGLRDQLVPEIDVERQLAQR